MTPTARRIIPILLLLLLAAVAHGQATHYMPLPSAPKD